MHCNLLRLWSLTPEHYYFEKETHYFPPYCCASKALMRAVLCSLTNVSNTFIQLMQWNFAGFSHLFLPSNLILLHCATYFLFTSSAARIKVHIAFHHNTIQHKQKHLNNGRPGERGGANKKTRYTQMLLKSDMKLSHHTKLIYVQRMCNV